MFKQGDGSCDDKNNNEACNWDGGDCCLDTLDTEYCNECLCLDPDGKKTTFTTSTLFPTSITTSVSSCEYMVRSFNSYNCFYINPIVFTSG